VWRRPLDGEGEPTREHTSWWLSASDRDAQAADALLRNEVHEAVAFHCQQSAEKALKALLVEHRVHERIGLLLEDWHGPVGLEPLGFTAEELLACCGPLVWSLLHEGVPVLDNGAFARAREKLQYHIDEGRLTPTPRGWHEAPDFPEAR